MRLAANVSTSGTQIVSIGPFRSRMRPPHSLIFQLRDGAAGASATTVQAAITDNLATAAEDVDGGDQLFVGPGGEMTILVGGLSSGDPTTNEIPIDPVRLVGRYISFELQAATGTLEGFVGVRLIG